jgi:hypothetical protein
MQTIKLSNNDVVTLKDKLTRGEYKKAQSKLGINLSPTGGISTVDIPMDKLMEYQDAQLALMILSVKTGETVITDFAEIEKYVDSIDIEDFNLLFKQVESKVNPKVQQVENVQ